MSTAAVIMTPDVVTVQPDTPIREVAELLSVNSFGSLPVITPDGKVIGLVTEEDMASRVAEIHLPRHINFLGGIIYLQSPQHFEEEAERILADSAREIMTEQVTMVQLDTPVAEIASVMLEHDIRRVIVVDADSRLQGIITRADIIRMQVNEGQFPGEKQVS